MSSSPTTTAITLKKKNLSAAVLFLALAAAAASSVATAFVIHHNTVKKSNRNANFQMKNSRPFRRLMGKIRMMKSLPPNVVKYSQVPKPSSSSSSSSSSPYFTADKIPRGLLKEHSTKSGTWGVIRINKGKLLYTINDKSLGLPPAEYVLHKDRVGVIEPQVKHEVAALTDDLEFVVEFYRVPGTGGVNEPREGL